MLLPRPLAERWPIILSRLLSLADPVLESIRHNAKPPDLAGVVEVQASFSRIETWTPGVHDQPQLHQWLSWLPRVQRLSATHSYRTTGRGSTL